MARLGNHLVVQLLDGGDVVILDEAAGEEVVIPVDQVPALRAVLDHFSLSSEVARQMGAFVESLNQAVARLE